VRPWAVDTASGVEDAPGKKSPEKVRAFVAAALDAYQRVGR
jgi:phosphoribosylanthranilate isomerase